MNGSRTSGSWGRRAIFLVALALCLVLSACGDDQDDLTTVDEETDVGTEDPPVVEGTPDSTDDAESDDNTDAQNTDSDQNTDGDQSIQADGDGTTADLDGTPDPDSTSAPEGSEQGSEQAGGTTESDPTGGTGQAGGAPGVGDGEGDEAGQPDAQVQVDDGDDEDDPAAVGRVDQGFPAAEATDLESGATVDLAAQLAGGTDNVLLWFWSPDSGPSEAEADVIQRLIAEDLDLEVVAIGVGGNPETARLFRDQVDLDGATVVWDHTTANAEQYEITAIPSAVLLDSGGDVIGRWTTLSAEVVQLLRLLSA